MMFPIPTGPPRVRTTTSFSCLPTFNTSDPYVKDIGFSQLALLHPGRLPYKGSLSFGLQFWFGLSSDPSLALPNRGFPPRAAQVGFLQAPLASPIYSLLSGLELDSHQLVVGHTGRTPVGRRAHPCAPEIPF